MGRSTQPSVLHNPQFDDWPGAFPNKWTSAAVVNTTVTQLDKRWPLDHPARAVFESENVISRSDRDFVWGGRYGLRYTFAAGFTNGDHQLEQPPVAGERGPRVAPGERYVLRVVARASIDDNQINVLMAPKNDTAVVAITYPSPAQTGWINLDNTNVAVTLKRFWTTNQFYFEVPAEADETIDGIFFRLEGQTAGAWTLDVGEVSIFGVDDKRY